MLPISVSSIHFFVFNFLFLQSLGVEIFVVAIGQSVDLREIQSVASNNNNVYQVSSSQEAKSIAEQWLQDVCQ